MIALASAVETISRRAKHCILSLALITIAMHAFTSSSLKLQSMNRKCLHDVVRELYLGR
jgi:hypothetical protein